MGNALDEGQAGGDGWEECTKCCLSRAGRGVEM